MIIPNISTLKNRFISFWETPISPQPLGIFRLAIASFTLLQAFIWYPDWMSFFGPDAWIQWEISRALNAEWSIHIEYVYRLFHSLGLSEAHSVRLFFWIYVIAATGLLVGWHTRIWAFLTWLCHYVIMSTIPTFVYGVDIFLHIALFYLMVMPVSKAYSLDVWLGRVSSMPTWGVTLSVRVLQVHLCLIYVSSGYEKMFSPEWWDGNVLWRALVQPDFRQFDFTWLAKYPWIPILLSWFTMLIETGYCIGMWIPRLRVAWLGGIIFLHLGIGLFLGLWLFGIIMILLSVSAFGWEVYNDIQRLNKEPLHVTKRSVQAAE